MVDVTRNAEAGDYCVTARPNWAFRADGRCAALAVLIPACSLVSLVCVLAGAWPVVPFFLVVMIALGYAFQSLRRHAGDFEKLTLHDGRLLIERHVPEQEQRVEVNFAWVQIVADERDRSRILLRAHGRDIPFGTLLTDEERAAIGGELRRRLQRAAA